MDDHDRAPDLFRGRLSGRRETGRSICPQSPTRSSPTNHATPLWSTPVDAAASSSPALSTVPLWRASHNRSSIGGHRRKGRIESRGGPSGPGRPRRSTTKVPTSPGPSALSGGRRLRRRIVYDEIGLTRVRDARVSVSAPPLGRRALSRERCARVRPATPRRERRSAPASPRAATAIRRTRPWARSAGSIV